jgi:hypothetical protein
VHKNIHIRIHSVKVLNVNSFKNSAEVAFVNFIFSPMPYVAKLDPVHLTKIQNGGENVFFFNLNLKNDNFSKKNFFLLYILAKITTFCNFF